MSRTYRLRHLPKHAITGWGGRWAARKIIDGGGSWRKWNDQVEKETEALVGPSPEKYRALIKAGTHHEYIPNPKPKPKGWALKDYWWNPWTPTVAVTLPGTWRPTEAKFQWDRARAFVENNLVRNVATWHPYAKGRHLGRGKMGEWRRRASREMRHRNRQVARDVMRAEDCDGDWARRDLYLNKWAFC